MDRISKLKEYLANSPEDSFLKHALALEYIKIDNDLDARDLLEEVLEKDPNYIGSYYHLGKLLERLNDNDLALQWYARGLAASKAAGDMHSYNELQSAYEELAD